MAAAGPAANTTVVIYTVPADHRTIVKDISIANGQPTAGDVYVVAVAAGSGVSTNLVPLAMGADARLNYPRWVVLEAGDELRVYHTKTGTTFWVSGTELEL